MQSQNKQTKQISWGILTILSLSLLMNSLVVSSGLISISYLKIENVDSIVPNAVDIGLGLEPEFAIQPDGTMEVIYLNPEAYENDLLYIDNSTGDWSSPVSIADPQYGVENPSMLIDAENHTFVSYQADGGSAYVVNNSDGTWREQNMKGSMLSASNPKMAIGPDNTIHMVYYWFASSYTSYTGGITYINNTHFEQQNTNNTDLRYEQFPDIAVDSAGLVHIVYEGSWNNTALGNIAVRDVFYQTFDPTQTEDYFSEPIRLTSVQSTMDYVQRPQIICDAEDNLHVLFVETEPRTENGYNVHRAYIKYMRLDDTPAPSDAVTIYSERSSSATPRFDIDSVGNVHVVFTVYPQTEYDHYYTADLMYATNETGSWTSERLTNQPYAVGFPRIAINPETDLPVILYLIKQTYTTDGYTMQYISKRGGSFGKHFDLTTELSAAENNVQVIQEEAYSYIQIVPKEAITATCTLENPSSAIFDYGISFKLIENDFISITNGSTEQTVTTVNAEQTTALSWVFEVSRGQSSELEIQMLKDGDIIGKIIYYFNIGNPSGGAFAINAASVVSILGVCGLGVFTLLLRSQKKKIHA